MTFGIAVGGVRRDHVRDPAEETARADPEAGRDDQPEEAAPEGAVVDLADAGNDEAEDGGSTGGVHGSGERGLVYAPWTGPGCVAPLWDLPGRSEADLRKRFCKECVVTRPRPRRRRRFWIASITTANALHVDKIDTIDAQILDLLQLSMFYGVPSIFALAILIHFGLRIPMFGRPGQPGSARTETDETAEGMVPAVERGSGT